MQADPTRLATFRQVGLLSRSGMPVTMAQRLTFEAARTAIEDLVCGHDGWPTERWFAKHVGVVVDDVRTANTGRGGSTCAA